MRDRWRARSAGLLVLAMGWQGLQPAGLAVAGEGDRPRVSGGPEEGVPPAARKPLGVLQASGAVVLDARDLAYAVENRVSTPVFAGTQIRTREGVARLDITDGTILQVDPGGAISLGQTGSQVSVRVGKGTTVRFRMPATGTTVFTTPTHVIENTQSLVAGTRAVASGYRIGVLRVDAAGAARLRMLEGEMLVTPRAGGRSQMVPAGTQVTVLDGGPVLVARAEPGQETENPAAGFGGNPPEGPLVAGGIVAGVGGAFVGGLAASGVFDRKKPASPSVP